MIALALAASIGFLSFIGLVVLWFHFWPLYRVAVLRSHLFEIRGALFDHAHATGTFDSVIYRDMEWLINATILYGQSLSFYSVILFQIFFEVEFPGRKLEHFRLKRLIESLDGSAPIYRDAMEAVNMRIFEFMVKSSMAYGAYVLIRRTLSLVASASTSSGRLRRASRARGGGVSVERDRGAAGIEPGKDQASIQRRASKGAPGQGRIT